MLDSFYPMTDYFDHFLRTKVIILSLQRNVAMDS